MKTPRYLIVSFTCYVLAFILIAYRMDSNARLLVTGFGVGVLAGISLSSYAMGLSIASASFVADAALKSKEINLPVPPARPDPRSDVVMYVDYPDKVITTANNFEIMEDTWKTGKKL